jgi:hypothetical protein
MRSNEENGDNPLIWVGTDLRKKCDSFCWLSIVQYDLQTPVHENTTLHRNFGIPFSLT